MKSTYAQCLAFTLRFEGGKVDDKRDPGGRTNQGVTQSTFSTWRAARGEMQARDVFTMTAAERDAIYAGRYWTPIKGDTLHEGVDLAVFDFGVNSGPARALKAYGKRTSNDPADTVKAVCAARLSFLHALGTFKTFGRGWTARVAACEALGVKMAEHARIGVPVDAPAAPQVASTLRTEATRASGKASIRRQGATGAGAGAVIGTASAPPSGGAHVPWELIAAPVAILVAIAGFLAWRASQHTARAAAYLAVAKGA